jgi:hypothetical protein
MRLQKIWREDAAWIRLALVRVQWQVPVNTIINLQVPQMAGNSLTTSVTIYFRWTIEGSEIESRDDQEFPPPPPPTSRPALGPTQPHIWWVSGALSPGVKRPGHDADHSPPSSAEVKKTWIPIFMTLGKIIMSPEVVWTAYLVTIYPLSHMFSWRSA